MRTPLLVALVATTLPFPTAQAFATAPAQTLRDAQRLNVNGFNPNGNNRIDGATIDACASAFVAVWPDQMGTTEFTQDIYFSRSTDGVTWSTPLRIDTGDMPNQHDSDFSKVAISDDGQTVVAVWQEKRDAFPQQSTNRDVFANVSTDGGVTWRPFAFPLNTASAGTNVDSDVERIWLTCDGSTFHCTWEEDLTAGAGGPEEVYYTRSTNGINWSTPVILSENPGLDDVDDPKVAADGGIVLVTWAARSGGVGNDDLWIARSTDGGLTFPSVRVVESDPSGDVDEPIVRIRGNTAIASYTETDSTVPGGEGIRAVISTDGGATWLPEETLSPQQYATPGGDADSPDVCILGPGQCYVVYDEDSVDRMNGGSGGSGGNRCYLAYTLDGGQTWTKEIPLANDQIANRPVIVAGQSALTIWFEFNANGSNVPAYQVSYDAGATWTAPIDVISAGPDVDEGANSNEGYYVVANPVTEDVVTIFYDRPTGANEVYVAGIDHDLSLGTNFCQANPNSSGQPSTITATGSSIVANDLLTLHATSLPTAQFGIFVVSRQTDFVPNAGGVSEGNLCLGGAIGRFFLPSQIVNSGATGTFSLEVSLTQFPQGAGFVQVQPGETWYFQAWHRDFTSSATNTSNFTDGLRIDFQ